MEKDERAKLGKLLGFPEKKQSSSEQWVMQPSPLTMGELFFLHERIRAIASMVSDVCLQKTWPRYLDALQQMVQEIRIAQRPYADLLHRDPPETEDPDFATCMFVALNFSRILPTQQSLDMLIRFHDALTKRQEELERPRF